jgi:hypothetical protein
MLLRNTMSIDQHLTAHYLIKLLTSPQPKHTARARESPDLDGAAQAVGRSAGLEGHLVKAPGDQTCVTSAEYRQCTRPGQNRPFL